MVCILERDVTLELTIFTASLLALHSLSVIETALSVYSHFSSLAHPGHFREKFITFISLSIHQYLTNPQYLDIFKS